MRRVTPTCVTRRAAVCGPVAPDGFHRMAMREHEQKKNWRSKPMN